MRLKADQRRLQQAAQFTSTIQLHQSRRLRPDKTDQPPHRDPDVSKQRRSSGPSNSTTKTFA
jgi:hypothetical protein